MGKLLKYIKPYKWPIALALFLKFLGTYAEIFIPMLSKIIIDEKVPTGDVGQIYLYGGLMVLCACSACALNITSNRKTAKTAGKITRKLRHDLFDRLQHLSPHQMDEVTVSSAVTRLTSDSYHFNNMLVRLQRIGMRAPILLLGCVISMLTMDSQLALILIALLPLIAITVFCVTKISVPLHHKVQEMQDNLVLICQENITGIRVIKALSKTEHEKQRFDDVVERRNRVSIKAGKVTSFTGPFTTLILNLGLTLLVLIGAYRVNSGGIKAGVIVAFLQYFTMMLNATIMLTRVILLVANGQASANRIAAVLSLPDDMPQLPAEAAEENAPHIEFRDVTFSYNGMENNLEHLSFSLQRGQTLGIMGPTGSGKSTIIKLLLRLYDVNSGQILVDGQDIRSIDPETFRKKFGVVFQNDFVKMATLRDNIRYYRDIADEDLTEAVIHAQAAGFVKEKGGLDGDVAVRGNNLSGGQKQRLLISRALAGDPEILILDDSSSALDYQTDAALRRALRQNYRNTTTVIIAQRVSSLRHADHILVLDDGEVIGAGNHESLMQSCEEYAHIAAAQMGEGEAV